MPNRRPPISGYERLAQTEEDEDQHLDAAERGDPNHGHARIADDSRQYAPVQPGPRADRMQESGRSASPGHRRQRSNSGIDLKALNARLERWADEIANKLKIHRGAGRPVDTERLEIQQSVFQPPEGMRPATAETLQLEYSDPPGARMTKAEFDAIVESVRVAIEHGIHPKLIAQGSSGSYFAMNSSGQVVGVFKPKDEEPYASRNPKWTKWIHRNLFPFFFGRACLIPNLSYVSEAAAYVLDTQLRCNLVPYTNVVSFSSKSFFYDFWDRGAFRKKKKPLPEKIGSFQVFLGGYKDATRFLQEHPWPDQTSASLNGAPRSKRRRNRWTDDCSRGDPSDDEGSTEPLTMTEEDRRHGFWTGDLQHGFREQLERLVILDYIMRNTDRGLDNWMIRVDRDTTDVNNTANPLSDLNDHARKANEPYRRPLEHMVATSRSVTPLSGMSKKATVKIGAIDNSLSWPWKHPDAWRSYPFGWLFLPVSLIGRPFTEATRQHFLPLLTSKAWWAETQLALKACFQQDEDFKERMFAKQMAVMKGQAWNVVETLKSPDHGPLELTRRARVHVWDDLVEVPIAVPLRSRSSEMRLKDEVSAGDGDGEMDLSTASLPAPRSQPRSVVKCAASDGDGANPFNISRHVSNNDTRDPLDTKAGTLLPPHVRVMSSSDLENSKSAKPRLSQRTRMSLDEGDRYSSRGSKHMPRRSSTSDRLCSALNDEDEGDLGYSATADREANRKQVIVERWEAVKSNNPVFTWC